MKMALVGSSGVLGNAINDVFKEKLDDIVSLGRNPEGKEDFVYCDLLDLDSISEAVEQVAKKTRIDFVVVNSGVIGQIAEAGSVELKSFNESLTINSISNLSLFQNFYAKGVRNFIVISSGAATKNYSGWFTYCMSKSMQLNIWKAIAHDYPDVSVNLIAPGVLKSSMHSFTESIDRSKFPELEKFFDIKEENSYQNPTESAEKILRLVSEVNFWKNNFEYIDLRNL